MFSLWGGGWHGLLCRRAAGSPSAPLAPSPRNAAFPSRPWLDPYRQPQEGERGSFWSIGDPPRTVPHYLMERAPWQE